MAPSRSSSSSAAAFVCAFLATGIAHAQLPTDAAAGSTEQPQRDVVVPAPAAELRPARRFAWHDSLFAWDNAVTTQTIGIGDDYQSRDPTYEMTFRLAPRFYFFEDARHDLSLRADARLLREFTNSDTTTDRGEWVLSDTEVWLAYVHALAEPGKHSELVLRLPTLSFPTSKISAAGGKILGVGFGIGVDQEVVLRGSGETLFPNMLLRPRLSYSYQFADAIVAVHGIDRIRLDPDDRLLPSDQLSGSALPQHIVSASFRFETIVIKDRLRLDTDVGLLYTDRYALPQSTCIRIETGCVMPQTSPEPTRWAVSTVFSQGLFYVLSSAADVGIGYANLSPQLGADGRRRSFFYSPDARAFVTLRVALGELYQSARGERLAEPFHTAALSRPDM